MIKLVHYSLMKGSVVLRKLNASQEKILAYLRECAQNGLPPSVREIGKATGLKSTSTVHAHLKSLEKNGYISREAGLNRAIHMTGSRGVQVPIVRQLKNETPMFHTKDIEGYVSYTDTSYQEEELFSLRMRNNSMKNFQILENDIMIAYKTDKVSNKDFVIAFCGDDIVVRQFLKEDTDAYLFTDHLSYPPIAIASGITILGKIISLVRHF